VFFTAARTRYLLDALSVLEVSRPVPGEPWQKGHLTLKDLSGLLGGEAERAPGNALVLDTSPTTAVRVGEVSGVFDIREDEQLALPARLVPLLAPAVERAVVHEGLLHFELDPHAAVRGLPRPTRKLELVVREAPGPCLCFESGGERFAVPLPGVLQVVPLGDRFNPSPGGGAFRGVLAHQGRLCPVFAVAAASPAGEPLVVLVESGGQLLGLAASRAVGVRSPEVLGGSAILDLERMFS
jgi:chemotaxis signal transduction protein